VKKMNCNWTEKISLLIDGELSAEEAGAVEQHAAQCHACQLAREDFMLMRRQINSFRAEPNLIAQRRALRNILGVASPEPSGGWRERAAGLFALPRFSPALAGVAALVIVAVVIAVVMMRRPERVEVAKQNPGAQKNTNAVVAPAPAASPEEVKAGGAPSVAPDKVEKATNKDGGSKENRRSAGEVRVETASTGKPRRATLLSASRLREEAAAARRARIVERLRLPLTPKVAVDNAEFAETELASASSKLVPADSGTARHVEQAQLLLRSFRNARAGGDEPSTSDIAYEKRRSRALLYRNIVLRREAASTGNVAVASLLDNLEPILIDIANLPDRPARDEVRSITDRMKKKNIVAMLQVANASRMY
jgi:negative regulator of sigma E activity